jgi:3D (Asp-Asp-Asp) domain-containing protein
VAETFRIEQEPVPFEIQWLPDSEMEIDTRSLKQGGENGVLQKRIRVRSEDGKEVSRQLEDSGVIREPKTKIISYGIKIIVRTLDTPNGPVEYWRKIKMLATSYSASTSGTPKSASYYGRTRLGWQMRFGIVAVDPAVIRLGSRVYVPNYGVGDAGDTGSAIKGKRIDLGYDDDDPRVWQWYRWTDVYLLTPVPDNFSYVIPDWPPEP